MKILLWSLLALFLLGNAFFVLPVNISGDKLAANYDINYKKDSLLLKNVFGDSALQLKLNMPAGYQMLYNQTAGARKEMPNQLFVNVQVFHNLDFTALCFPFYKLCSFNGIIPFYSIIKASNAPDMDSTALVGNIIVHGKLSVAGISTPTYARALVEQKLVAILKSEMDKIELEINRRPDSIPQVVPQLPAPVAPVKKLRGKRR